MLAALAFFLFLFGVPLRIIVKRVAGKHAVKRMRHDDDDEDYRDPNQVIIPVHFGSKRDGAAYCAPVAEGLEQ